MDSQKLSSVMAALDWSHAGLRNIAKDDNGESLLTYLAQPSRGRYLYEYERKSELTAFLRESYPSWRNFDTTKAECVRTRTIKEAQGHRALGDVIELGKAWLATDDPAYGAAFGRFYNSVPTGEMFNYGAFNGKQPTHELEAWFLLQDCPGFDNAGRIAFLDHLRAIADEAWDVHTAVWRQIDLGPEGHNWYLHGAQIHPFFVLFPEFKRAPFFVQAGVGIVEEHLRGHYKADGGARETTLGYQWGSLVEMWTFYCVMHRNGVPLSSGFAERLLHATRFLLDLMSPAGGTPSFGDTHHVPGQLAFLAAIATALTGDGICKWYTEQCRSFMPHSIAGMDTPGVLPEPVFWRVGLAGAATYAATPAINPHLTSVLKGDTGYAAMRDSDKPDACYMAIAAANRGPIVTSHGHNDVFSLEIHSGGVRFVGEMGCTDYGDFPARMYDESTAGHTCLTVDNLEQAPLAGEWRWYGHILPAIRRWITEPSHDFFHGVHEGFYRYRERHILHARKVLFIKGAPQYWLIFDWLDTKDERDVTAYFHGCVPGTIEQNRILLRGAGGEGLAIYPPQTDHHITVTPEESEGLSAYIAERKLKPENYPCFAYRTKMESGCLVWAIVPHRSGATLPQLKRIPASVNNISDNPAWATALELDFGDYCDTLCLSHTEYDAQLNYGTETFWGIMRYQRHDKSGKELASFSHTVRDGGCGY